MKVIIQSPFFCFVSLHTHCLPLPSTVMSVCLWDCTWDLWYNNNFPHHVSFFLEWCRCHSLNFDFTITKAFSPINVCTIYCGRDQWWAWCGCRGEARGQRWKWQHQENQSEAARKQKSKRKILKKIKYMAEKFKLFLNCQLSVFSVFSFRICGGFRDGSSLSLRLHDSLSTWVTVVGVGTWQTEEGWDLRPYCSTAKLLHKDGFHSFDFFSQPSWWLFISLQRIISCTHLPPSFPEMTFCFSLSVSQ